MTVSTEEFIAAVFDGVPEGETALIAKQAKRGFINMPADNPRLQRMLEREKSALYFNISTVVEQDPLRRRSEDCRAVHCMVLDDIGSKVEDPPVEPSWILETSPGSYQWGYLIQPTEELDKFAALMDAIADAGYTDAGAKGFNRLMRIPGSVNLKPGRDNFKAELVAWSPEIVFETLEEIAEAFNVQIGVVQPRDRTKTTSDLVALELNVEDPVAEWLFDNGTVVEDEDEWLIIECPNCDEHTTGDDTARYSPLGRGEGDWKYTRGFKCFHEHCKDFDLLDWVSGQGGPTARRYDPLPFIQQRYVYVRDGRRVCDLHALAAGSKYYDMALEEFGDMFASVRIHMPTTDNPKRTLAGKSAFVADEDTTKCASYETVPYAPGESGRGGVEPVGNDQLIVNTYQPPAHTAEPAGLDVFLEHMKFLLPDGEDCMTFLDWLAYKLQNPRARSYGVVMVADDSFGIGRSWLGDVLRIVWGNSNVEFVDIGELTGHGQSAGFNEWASGRQMVVIEEAHDGSDMTHYKAYERIKTFIDPRTTHMQVNRKFGRKGMEQIWFNLLVFSNHVDAFNIPKGERRLAVFANPQEKQSESYYNRLWNVYNKQGAGLAAAIHQFLMERDVSKFNPAVPPVTESKDAMIESSVAPGTIITDAMVARAQGELVTKHMLSDLFESAERAERLENTVTNNARRRLIDKLWRTLPKLKDAKDGFRSRAAGGNPEEIRAFRRAYHWKEEIVSGVDPEVLKGELARTARGVGSKSYTTDGIEQL